MEYRYELLGMTDETTLHPLRAQLAKYAVLDTPDRRAVRLADVLGIALVETIDNPVTTPAISAICWDEGHIFGDFRPIHPENWLAAKIATELSSHWTAEGYGLETRLGCPLVRWIAWEVPKDEDASSTAWTAMSATACAENLIKTIDPILIDNLVELDPSVAVSGVFVAAVAPDVEAVEKLMDVALKTIHDHLTMCMNEHRHR